VRSLTYLFFVGVPTHAKMERSRTGDHTTWLVWFFMNPPPLQRANIDPSISFSLGTFDSYRAGQERFRTLTSAYYVRIFRYSRPSRSILPKSAALTVNNTSNMSLFQGLVFFLFFAFYICRSQRTDVAENTAARRAWCDSPV
jgi:hypothetical protein